MTTAISAATFLNTLGVNTHLDFGGTYADVTQVEQNLIYLGVTNVRDSAETATDAQTWLAVAEATGVKFDDYIAETSQSGMQTDMSYMTQLANEGILNAIEGGDEEDDSYPQSLGNTLSATAQVQQQLSALGKTLGLPVINMSFGSGWTAANDWQGDYGAVGNLAAYATYANAHTYPNVGQTPNSGIQQINGLAELAASGQPVMTTEIGWSTASVSETTIAKYVLDATMDGILDGDARMYFYALYDDSSGDWGLFNNDGTPRPAATALHDLTTLLSDTGSNAATFTPGSLNFTLSGTQSGDESVLIEKSDGSFWLSLWNESEAANSPHTVTVALGTQAATVIEYDPLTGTSSIESWSNVSSVQVSVPDHPVLLEIVPAAGSSTTSSAVSTSGSGTSSGSTSSSSTDTTTTTTTTTTTGPSIALPSTETAAAGSTIAVSGVSITDAFAASNPGNLTLNLSATSGTIKMTGSSGTALTGSGTHALSVSGTLAQINADLATLTYTAGSAAGGDVVIVDVWDQAGLEATKDIGVTVTAAASASTTSSSSGSNSSSTTSSSSSSSNTSSSGTSTSGTSSSGTSSSGTSSSGTSSSSVKSSTTTTPTGPSIAAPASESLAAGATTAVSGVVITDAFAASNPGSLILNITDTTGTIAMTGTSGTVTGSGTHALSVTGTLAQINADLATLSYTAGSSGSDSIVVDVWDQAGLESTKSVAVTVSAPAGLTISASNIDPVELVNNEVISATSGTHLIFIGGTGDTVTATGGTEIVQAYHGHNTITTGTGNDTISFGATDNVINAGAGSNILEDSGSNNTIVMPGANQGFDDIFGYVLQNGDTLDFRAALASTAWTGSASTLANFLSVSMSGNSAIVSLSTASHGTAVQIAKLENSGVQTLTSLLSHAIT